MSVRSPSGAAPSGMDLSQSIRRAMRSLLDSCTGAAADDGQRAEHLAVAVAVSNYAPHRTELIEEIGFLVADAADAVASAIDAAIVIEDREGRLRIGPAGVQLLERAKPALAAFNVRWRGLLAEQFASDKLDLFLDMLQHAGAGRRAAEPG